MKIIHTHADKTQENRSQSVANKVSQKQGGSEFNSQFLDNRPEAIQMRKLQEMANYSPQAKQLRAFQEMANTSSQINGQAHKLRVVNDRPPANTIQRYPEAMDDDSAKALGSLYSEEYSEKEDDDYTAEELSEIKSGVYMLTDLAPKGMTANCIGWAQNSDSIEPTGSIYTWESEDHLNYTPTAVDAGDAKIILWGTKDSEDENDRDIRHASVLLTHNEIATRSREFGGFGEITTQALSEAGIDDPCWTSVGGFGFGAMVHPRNWHEGGDFGTALKGMK